ncbi:hypothetical protein MKS83_04635 [Chryseobacterium sp. Y16C]|uniref:hypothetical protein n=1 Tax=Chryseobacterium sp. Y16C TaxID=2920939 RepID=UPI001F0A1092|nr:hypothetical protein [Chryseobacterium sp. Y16C]UMQ42978.1 hypothetical protein MKS83_04635 [Chryseobacterium sp. Y16C]
MQFKSVKKILFPLIKGGQEWQNININGKDEKPKFYLSDVQWFLFIISILIIFKLTKGISKDLIGYIMSAFSISVSLFMSLLVSIFDKFENTNLSILGKNEEEIVRLKQKKNFFKRFISITSYLVVLSIFIIILCSINYIFDLSLKIDLNQFTIEYDEIDIYLTIKFSLLIIYRILLNYFLLNYLFLTLFVTSSAYEYYISEINRRKIQ